MGYFNRVVTLGVAGVPSGLRSNSIYSESLWSYDDFMTRHRVRLDCDWGIPGGLCVLVLSCCVF